MPRRKIRKQVYELTEADLVQHPVWEYCQDEVGVGGQDEATVRPWLESRTTIPAHGGLIVRATFTANDGTLFPGYFKPDATPLLGYLQPTIVTSNGQVNFWSGLMRPAPEELKSSYRLLGKTPELLFPIHFRTEFELPQGWRMSGALTGFSGLKRLGSDETFELR